MLQCKSKDIAAKPTAVRVPRSGVGAERGRRAVRVLEEIVASRAWDRPDYLAKKAVT
jgi:hypothetical protein